MFSREQILRSAVFAVIGGIITVVVLKLLENEETAAQREIREEDDLNENDKKPREHDERLCWEGGYAFHIFIGKKQRKIISFKSVGNPLIAEERRHCTSLSRISIDFTILVVS